MNTGRAFLSSLRTRIILWNVLVLALLISAVDRQLDRQATSELPPAKATRGPHHGRGRENERDDGKGPPGLPPDEMFDDGHPPLRSPMRPHEFDLTGLSIPSVDDRPAWDSGALAGAGKGRRTYSTLLARGENLRILTQPRRDQTGKIIAVVQAVYPMADVSATMASADRSLIMITPVALLCAALGGALLTKRVLNSMSHATQAANQITALDMSGRLPEQGDDEFAKFARTFNGMLNRLEFSFGRQENLLEQQKRFTADVSHELKTPLTVIKGSASMALSGERKPEAYRQAMREIDEAAESMSHLVQDLLLLARFDVGQLGNNRIELPLYEVLDQAISSASKEGPPIDVLIEDESLCVVGNQRELVRLFGNLLSNAKRHTPADGRVQIAAVRRKNAVTVSVSDTGSGIAPEHIPHLGQRFYRIDAARSRPDGGTGLGLSICIGIAAAHHGSLTVESELGAGTTVRVSLPGLPI